eukprot:767712-Hanusia_phi.AAC.4
MLAKFAEDERIEQMNAQRRRMKMMEHKREVERLIEERRKMYEEEKEVTRLVVQWKRAEQWSRRSWKNRERRRGEHSAAGPAGAHRARASAHTAGGCREAGAGVHAERRVGIQGRPGDVQSSSICQQVQMRHRGREAEQVYSFISNHETLIRSCLALFFHFSTKTRGQYCKALRGDRTSSSPSS